MWLADMLGTKQNRFFALAQRHVAQLVEAAETLERYVRGGPPDLPDHIEQIEQAADETLSETIAELTNTFITPYDRQDIYNLAEGVDDMIDYIADAAREIKLFQVELTPAMCTMAEILTRATHEIQNACLALQKDAHEAQVHAANASRTEDEMEDLYRQTLASLFEETDVHRIFKLREIYRHFSNSADRANALGRQIGKIVVKTA
jgi:predicted phosphate transport protein (TIGR00153 family)